MSVEGQIPADCLDDMPNLGDIRETCAAISWIWPNWLANGLATLIVAAPGVGKSSFALLLAHCLHSGCHWPDGSPNNCTRGATLWTETEHGHSIHAERALRLHIEDGAVIFSAPFEDVVSFSDGSFLSRVQHLAKDPRIAMTVIDSLQGGSTGDENGTQASAPMQFASKLAQMTGKPTIVIHHLNKQGWKIDLNNPPTIASVRGSGAIVQHARVIIAIDAPIEGRPDLLRLTVIKNNFSPERPSIGLRLTESGLIPFDLRSVIGEARTNDLSARDAKILALDKDCKSLREISKETGVPKSTVSDVLKRNRPDETTSSSDIRTPGHSDIAQVESLFERLEFRANELNQNPYSLYDEYH